MSEPIYTADFLVNGRAIAAFPNKDQPYAIFRVVRIDPRRSATIHCSWTKREYTIKDGESFDVFIQGHLIRVWCMGMFTDRVKLTIVSMDDEMEIRRLRERDSIYGQGTYDHRAQ